MRSRRRPRKSSSVRQPAVGVARRETAPARRQSLDDVRGRWRGRASRRCRPARCRSRAGSSSARARTRRCRRCRRTPARETPASSAPSWRATAAGSPGRRGRRSRRARPRSPRTRACRDRSAESRGTYSTTTIASAPPRNDARASATMSVVDGVILHHTGTLATSFTTCVTIEISPSSLPMLEPMSCRSMCGHDRFSSKRVGARRPGTRVASVCQCRSSRSLPDPAMIEATRMRSGCASLIRASRGSHQSSGLSEISSQFHDECSAVPGRFCIDRW